MLEGVYLYKVWLQDSVREARECQAGRQDSFRQDKRGPRLGLQWLSQAGFNSQMV